VTKHLEGYGCEPANADELAQVCPYCDGARDNDQNLHKHGVDVD